VHLTELPPGWLGKNHALQYGAERSSGEWLLFTDADIVFEPTALRRAVRYAEVEGLDHVAVGPQTHSMGWMLEAMVVAFCYMFSLYAMPWKAKNPRSTAHVGIGAFNLVRADVFQGIGGMRPVAMRPDDDLKLGKLIKKNGHRQEFLNGCGMISVEWYASVWQLVVGLEKNVFAAAGYSVVIMLGGILFLFLTNAWPFLAIFLTWGTTRWMYLAAAVGLWMVAARAAREISLPMSRAIAFPVCILIFCYINWRAMWLTLRQGGIRWRETHYSLAELRENVV
jgi:glycosyltransferase involved in cell wall biosynthesis